MKERRNHPERGLLKQIFNQTHIPYTTLCFIEFVVPFRDPTFGILIETKLFLNVDELIL
jgi:hypothetical protein